ncbi:hypothetical protein RBB50_006196 [Rhinocladiella similis]
MAAAPYSHEKYMALKDLKTAHETFISLSGHEFVQTIAKPLLQETRCHQTWGVTLLYRAYDLSPAENLVKCADAATPYQISHKRDDHPPIDFEIRKRMIITSEPMSQQGVSSYMPVEFEVYQQHNEPSDGRTEWPDSFLTSTLQDEFARQTHLAGLDGVLGLATWPHTPVRPDFKAQLECIEDRAVVYYDHGEFGFEGLVDAVQTGWFWWDGEPGAREAKVWTVDRRVKKRSLPEVHVQMPEE